MENQSLSLIKISNELQNIANQIQEMDGEITPEIETRLAEYLDKSAEKVTNYCLLLDSLESQKAFVFDQIKKAAEYAGRLEKIQKTILDRAAFVMNQLDTKTLEGNYGKKLYFRSSQSTEVKTDTMNLPEEYIKVQTTMSPDKLKIKEALKQGIEIEGCKLVEKQNILWK